MTDNNRLQEIAERIKELREIFAYSKEEMAAKTDVTIAEYAMYEGAELDFPFTFRYIHNGDGETFGKNRLEISNIRLHVEDFQETGAELLTEGPIEFEPTYVGYDRYTTVNVQLKNTGSKPLSVTGFKAETENSPFLSILPTYSAQFNNTLDVRLVFYPGVHLDANGNVTFVDETVGKEDTWYSDKVTIMTTAGDFTLDVSGM